MQWAVLADVVANHAVERWSVALVSRTLVVNLEPTVEGKCRARLEGRLDVLCEFAKRKQLDC
jgi:hypothetical protein